MISKLYYGPDCAHVSLSMRISSATSAPEFCYVVKKLQSEFDTLQDNQADYFLPGILKGGAQLKWRSTEEETRKDLVKTVVNVFNEFNTWPQYLDHGYLPGEEYSGKAVAYPPGQDPRAK